MIVKVINDKLPFIQGKAVYKNPMEADIKNVQNAENTENAIFNPMFKTWIHVYNAEQRQHQKTVLDSGSRSNQPHFELRHRP